MTSIQLKNKQGQFQHHCGGSVINENFIITAAHCVVNISISKMQLVFGTTKLDMINEKRFVKQSYVHPMYHSDYFYYDLALLELDNPLQFSPSISPVCIPTDPINDVDSRRQQAATWLGWGKIGPGKNVSASSVLRQTLMKVFSQTFCNSTRTINDQNGNPISWSPYLPKLFQSDLICAGYEGGVSTSCPGDSGGPLVIFDSIRHCYTQIGVATGGHCGSTKYHGAFTRLEDPQVLDFIYRYAFGRTIINIGMLKFYKII